MGEAAASEPLAIGYAAGTHRLVPPELTLARVRAHQDAIGVTRLADLTGLDRLGIPVCCAIRPWGLILQSSNGKGARPIDAQVSAMMEALDHHHAEHPPANLRRAAARTIRGEGQTAIDPRRLPAHRADTFWSEDFVIEWAPADDLLGGERAWLPASAVYSGRLPCLHDFTANGLASGNHLIEATLHAIYEVLERDAVSRLSVGGRVRVSRPACRVVDISTLRGIPGALAADVDRAGVAIVLIWVRSRIDVHTFWAALLDRTPASAVSTVNVGYGTHLSPEVAATRAITEAAQSRLCFIHGVREDLAAKISDLSLPRLRAVFEFFERLMPDAEWGDFDDRASRDLRADYDRVLGGLRAAGVGGVYRSDLTRQPFDIPVVRVVAPGLRLNRRLF